MLATKASAAATLKQIRSRLPRFDPQCQGGWRCLFLPPTFLPGGDIYGHRPSGPGAQVRDAIERFHAEGVVGARKEVGDQHAGRGQPQLAWEEVGPPGDAPPVPTGQACCPAAWAPAAVHVVGDVGAPPAVLWSRPLQSNRCLIHGGERAVRGRGGAWTSRRHARKSRKEEKRDEKRRRGRNEGQIVTSSVTIHMGVSLYRSFACYLFLSILFCSVLHNFFCTIHFTTQ